MTDNKIELSDDCAIKVTLPNNQWNVVIDWLAHCPFVEAKETLEAINKQIDALDDEGRNAKEFVCSLPIKTYNMLIFALGLAPYYTVVNTIQAIYAQGQEGIQKLRDEANTLPEAVRATEGAKKKKTTGAKSGKKPHNNNEQVETAK